MTTSEQGTEVAILAGLFGLLGTLAPIVDARLRNRDESQKVLSDLERDSMEIDFWMKWIEAVKTVSDSDLTSSKKVMLSRLEAIATNRKFEASTILTVPIERQISGFRKVFLLYLPLRKSAWVPQIFFYFFLIYLILAVTINRQDFTTTKPLVWMLLLAVITLSLSFRQIAVSLGRENRNR